MTARASTRLVLLALLAASGAAAANDESSVVLKDAPGRDALYANCLSCHSADYVLINSPFLDEKGWRNSVNKMIKVMGAQIAPEDVEVIVRYLAEHYGAPPAD